MKRIAAILLLLLFCSPFIFKIFVVTHWFANKQYIVKNLCIQKDEAINTCQGSCHLKAELAKLEEAKENQEGSKTYKVQEDYKEFVLHELVCIKQILNWQGIGISFEQQFNFQEFISVHAPPPKFV